VKRFLGKSGERENSGRGPHSALWEVQDGVLGGFLHDGTSSRQAESAARSHGIETMALDRFTLSGTDPRGILLGFAAFDHRAIKRGVASLALALSKREP
jgi:DNA-binding transcriptional MocR family regulator